MNTVSIEYICKFCCYKTVRKDCYDAHIRSNRHKKMANGYDKKYKYECDFCLKKYIHCASLPRHERKCKIKKLKEIQNLKKDTEKDTEKETNKLKKEVEELKMMLAEKDKAYAAIVGEKDKAMVEMAGKVGNNVSINLYLNKHCKDAIPIMEFIKNLTFKLKNIDPNRPSSTIESLSNVVIDELRMLEDTKRPIHCSDAKRLKFYIKDASAGWIQDENNKKIDKAIGWANMRHQGAWYDRIKEERLDMKKNDTDYFKMNIAMAKFSDNPAQAKMKIKRAIAGATNLKNSKNAILQMNQ